MCCAIRRRASREIATGSRASPRRRAAARHLVARLRAPPPASAAAARRKSRLGAAGRRPPTVERTSSSEREPIPPPPAAAEAAALEALAPIFSKLSSSDWLERKEGIAQLQTHVSAHHGVIVSRGKVLTIFDHLTPRLTDVNSKVNVVALQSLQAIIPKLRDGLPAVTAALVPALATSIASSNFQVRSIAPPIVDALVAHVDHAALIVPLANCSLYGAAARARPAMVARLTRGSHALYGTTPALVQKHSVPTALRLLESNQPDMRPHTDMLLRTLYGLMGDTLMELAQKSPQGVQQRLREVVQTL